MYKLYYLDFSDHRNFVKRVIKHVDTLEEVEAEIKVLSAQTGRIILFEERKAPRY